MSERDRLVGGERLRAACRCVRGWLDVRVRACTRIMAAAGVVAGSLLLVPALADASPPRGSSAQPAAPAAAAPGASTPPRVSPYAVVARQRAQAASGAAHAPAVPPTIRRNRKPIGQRVQR